MGKRQDCSVTACVFLFLSLASQIHCTSQTHLSRSKRGVGSSGDNRHFNVLSRVPSLKEKDLIKKLPGQPSVSFRQYGGYVTVDERASRFLFYYFVEAIKPTASTPLVLWFNGGTYISYVEIPLHIGTIYIFKKLNSSKKVEKISLLPSSF